MSPQGRTLCHLYVVKSGELGESEEEARGAHRLSFLYMLSNSLTVLIVKFRCFCIAYADKHVIPNEAQ